MSTVSSWFIGSALLAILCWSPLGFSASPDQEARQFLQQSFDAMFSKCGDSYFTKWYPMGFKGESYIVVQLKDLTMTFTPEALTAIDTRQDITWKGKALLRSTGRRSYPVDASTKNSWGEWLKHRTSDPVLLIQKQRGEWKLRIPTQFGPYGLTAFERIDCDKVPQGD
jgi:hypothetical protein